MGVFQCIQGNCEGIVSLLDGALVKLFVMVGWSTIYARNYSQQGDGKFRHKGRGYYENKREGIGFIIRIVYWLRSNIMG